MVEKYKLYYRCFIVIFWVAMTFGFVADEFLPFLERMRTPVFLLIDVVLLGLGVATMRRGRDIAVAASFVVIAVVSTLFINHESVKSLVNGSRDFFGLIFLVPMLNFFFINRHSAEFKRKIDKQLRIWLYVQAVCVTWQFLRYGAGDHGGGSIGNGCSGMVSMLIYATSFYLTIPNWDFYKLGRSFAKNKENFILLFPTFLNETKVSFILLLIYFVMLFKLDRRMMMKIAISVPVGIGALIGVGALYFSATNQRAEQVLSSQFFKEYLYGEDVAQIVDLAIAVQDGDIEIDPRDWWVVDMPRFAKLALIFPVLETTPGGVLWGAGLGQYKGQQTGGVTGFYEEYAWLLQGSKPWLLFVVVELGLIGCIWNVGAFVNAMRIKRRKNFATRRVVWFVALELFVVTFYLEILRNPMFCFMLFYFVSAIYHTKVSGGDAGAAIEPCGEQHPDDNSCVATRLKA